MAIEKSSQDLNREGMGWLILLAMMFLFPALFFLCVFFPMWIGWAQVWY